jgi:CheY-like chemotaxis protein
MSREIPLKLSGRILVVDDSADARSIMSRVLRCIGIETDEAQDGKVACEKALYARESGRPFDLILMDIYMPVMNGFDATAMLRLNGYTGRIAALTAHTGTDPRQDCLDAGCDDYVMKPIDFESLRDLVQRHINAANPTPGAKRRRACVVAA